MLLNKLPKGKITPQLFLDEEVSLQYYRNQIIFEGAIGLEGDTVLKNTVHAGKKKEKDEVIPLSELVKKINDLLNTEFKEEDMLMVEQLFHDMTANDDLRAKAQSNSLDRFSHPCDAVLMDFIIDRIEKNDRFATQMLDNEAFSKIIKDVLIPAVYNWFQKNPD